MTKEEFNNTNWHCGNTVRLNNGKEYRCMGTATHGRYLLLYSKEYDKLFVADHHIIECRTSDYEEPEEEHLRTKTVKRAFVEGARKSYTPASVTQTKPKAVVPVTGTPKKRVRQRVRIVKKVDF